MVIFLYYYLINYSSIIPLLMVNVLMPKLMLKLFA